MSLEQQWGVSLPHMHEGQKQVKAESQVQGRGYLSLCFNLVDNRQSNSEHSQLEWLFGPNGFNEVKWDSLPKDF